MKRNYYEWRLKKISEQIKELDGKIAFLSEKYGSAYWNENLYRVGMPKGESSDDYFVLLDSAVSKRNKLKNKLERFFSLIRGEEMNIYNRELEKTVKGCLIDSRDFEHYLARDGYGFYLDEKKRMEEGKT